MVLKRKLTEEEFQKLLDRVHLAIMLGDYHKAAQLLVTNGIVTTGRELAIWLSSGNWQEVA